MAKERLAFCVFTLHYILIRLLKGYLSFSLLAPDDREPGA